MNQKYTATLPCCYNSWCEIAFVFLNLGEITFKTGQNLNMNLRQQTDDLQNTIN